MEKRHRTTLAFSLLEVIAVEPCRSILGCVVLRCPHSERHIEHTRACAHTHTHIRKVAVEHLTMLIGLVEEMTSKWERHLETFGEGSFTDEMLGREGTKCKLHMRTA